MIQMAYLLVYLSKEKIAIVLRRFARQTCTESLTELLCCVVHSLSQSSLYGETAQYNGYLFFKYAYCVHLFRFRHIYLPTELLLLVALGKLALKNHNEDSIVGP